MCLVSSFCLCWIAQQCSLCVLIIPGCPLPLTLTAIRLSLLTSKQHKPSLSSQTLAYTHTHRQTCTDYTLAMPCPEKSFYACAIVQVKLHSTFYDRRDKYHTGMQWVSGQFRLIFIKSVPPPALIGLVQVVTWEPASGYPTKVFHFKCHHWFKVEPHKNCILIMSSNRETSFYWTTFTGKFFGRFDFLKLMKALKYIHLKSV